MELSQSGEIELTHLPEGIIACLDEDESICTAADFQIGFRNGELIVLDSDSQLLSTEVIRTDEDVVLFDDTLTAIICHSEVYPEVLKASGCTPLADCETVDGLYLRIFAVTGKNAQTVMYVNSPDNRYLVTGLGGERAIVSTIANATAEEIPPECCGA